MTKEKHDTSGPPGQQSQNSRQSGGQEGVSKGSAADRASAQSRPGIGSSQGQDRGSRDEQQRPSAGTPDIERGGGSDIERGASASESEGESLVKDPTGAFKERP